MSRASYEQVNAIINFMEKHPMLALGQNKTLEDRFESKGLWQEVAVILNAIKGAKKTAKGWAKFWADKKCNIRKLAMLHGNADTGSAPSGFSPLDKKILGIVGFRDKRTSYSRFKRVKREVEPSEEFEEEQSVDFEEMDKPLEFVDRPIDSEEERHTALMDKLFQVMSEQASALTKLAQASQTQAHALDRLADSSQQQANAAERLADTVERIADSLAGTRTSVAGIESTARKAYGNGLS